MSRIVLMRKRVVRYGNFLLESFVFIFPFCRIYCARDMQIKTTRNKTARPAMNPHACTKEFTNSTGL